MRDGSYKNAAVVTPSDTVLFAKMAARLYTATAGTVTVLTANNQVVQFTSVAGGTLPIQCKRVNSSGTSATGIVALW